MEYEFIMFGKDVFDNKNYKVSCICEGMSNDEKQDWIKENNFDKASVKIVKYKLKNLNKDDVNARLFN